MSTIVAEVIRDGYLINPLMVTYHEVGHALIAARCGREVTRLTVNAHGGLATSEGPASPQALLLVSLAGDAAEHLAPGAIEGLADLDEGSKDKSDVEFALDLIGRDAVHRAFVAQDARRQVEEVLAAERDRLDYIARMLLRRQRLEGRELRALLQ